jgi:hypothetical protein
MRLTGFAAIEFAEQEGLTLNKLADHIDTAVSGLTVAEAEAIADDNPDLIWLEVPADEYYGTPRNMEPGTELTRPPRRAGQLRDELSPGEDSGAGGREGAAAGTPAGGAALGGMGGTNAPYAVADENELDAALAVGRRDAEEELEDPNEPQSGRSGGAVGGTPAGKRVSPK